jgi:hypothetical protein
MIAAQVIDILAVLSSRVAGHVWWPVVQVATMFLEIRLIIAIGQRPQVHNAPLLPGTKPLAEGWSACL